MSFATMLAETRLHTCSLQARPFRAARPSCRPAVVCCMAQQRASDGSASSRRALLATLSCAPAALVASQALALLPDDDDEDLVNKAKENRRSKLKSEITTEKKFARTEGFKDTSLAPLQKAVTQLARVGSQLSSGDVSAASGTLGGSWADEVAKAAGGVSDFSSVSGAISALTTACAKGDLGGAKSKFVAATSALQSWAQAAGVASQLRGL